MSSHKLTYNVLHYRYRESRARITRLEAQIKKLKRELVEVKRDNHRMAIAVATTNRLIDDLRGFLSYSKKGQDYVVSRSRKGKIW